MAESDGLKKLTEYLNQTRRQAEGAIDVLNEKIAEIQTENDLLVKMVNEIEGERDHYKEYSEKLKNENAIKWKLQERDDWKALVDSVQKDRARLQDQCNNLELELEQSKEEIEILRHDNALLVEQQQLHQQQHQLSQNQIPLGLTTPEKQRINPDGLRLEYVEGDSTDESGPSPQNSPIFDRSGKEMTYLQTETPRVVAKTLKAELKRAHTQIENERRRAEEDALLQQVEITRLKEELNALLPRVNHSHHNNSSSSGGGGAMVPYHYSAQHQQVTKKQSAESSWFGLGLLGNWFATSSSSSSSGHRSSGHSSGDKAGDALKKSAFLV